jgi:hypothetical protein
MDMKKFKAIYLAGLVLFVAGVQVSEGTPPLLTWQLGTDFSISNGNPNNLGGARAGSSWSYGLTTGSGSEPTPSSFTSLAFPDNSGTVFLPGLEGWSYASGNPNPAIVHNPTGSTISGFGIVWNPNDVTFDTYHGGGVPFFPRWVDARWTAPASGTYEIFANFQNDQDPTGSAMRIYRNNTPLFSATTANANGASVGYNAGFELLAGDKIDFDVNFTGSAYRVFAEVDLVPEPTSAALLALSAAVFAVRLRRRNYEARDHC